MCLTLGFTLDGSCRARLRGRPRRVQPHFIDVARHAILPVTTVVSRRSALAALMQHHDLRWARLSTARARGLQPAMLRYAAQTRCPNVTGFGMALARARRLASHRDRPYLTGPPARGGAARYPLMQASSVIALAVLAANWLVDPFTSLIHPSGTRRHETRPG
jgi:hypothetical protein